MSAFLYTILFVIGASAFAIALAYWDKGGYANNWKALWWGIGAFLILGAGMAISFFNMVILPSKGGATPTPVPSSPTPSVKPARQFTERSSTLTVTAGTGRITLPAKESKEPVWMSSGGIEPFSARLCEGLLCIDADIYAGADRPPIKVRNTEIIDRPAEWDKNWDDKGVEIVNERGDPVFQLEYVNDSTASVKGLFLTKGTVVICDDSGAWRPAPVLALKRQPEKYSIAPLFKYPSKDFLGKRLPPKEDVTLTKPSPDEIATQLKGFDSTPPADALKSIIGLKVKWRVWFVVREWAMDERRSRDDTRDDFLFTTGTNNATAMIFVPTGKDCEDRSADLVKLSPYLVEGSIEHLSLSVFHGMRSVKIWLTANTVVKPETLKEQFTP